MKFVPLLWANLMRNKLRTGLTVSAIALAVALVCMLLTMPSGLAAIVTEVTSDTRIVVHSEAGPVYPLPYAYLQKIRMLPGVVAAASWTSFGGMRDVDEGIRFPSFAIEPGPIESIWPDYGIHPDQIAAFERQRNGALVGRATLRQNDWTIGDRVTLVSARLGVALEFEIVGEIPDPRAPHFWFQREYLDQALRDASGRASDTLEMVWLRVDDASQAGSLIREIDALFRNSDAATAAETEQSYIEHFLGQLHGIVAIILIVTGLVVLCVLGIAANTASLSVRERMTEIAVLKTIGFSRRLLFATLLAETTVLAGLGGCLGALASFAITSGIRHLAVGWDPQLAPLGHFAITDAILAQGVGLALLIGVVAGAIPAGGAVRRSVSSILHEVF